MLSVMKHRIIPSKKYPFYWQYNGEPILLIGGSVEDNLFQIPDIKAHLELLKSAGGNYVRCTMSCRDEGNVGPFERTGDLYDLEKLSEEYWKRFSDFLSLTYDMDIVVQIEIWATFDFYREWWDVNPFNPKNNRNYRQQESGLPFEVNSHPLKLENNFFRSVPEADNNKVILKYQQKFADAVLLHSLDYPHVLYCMDNETAVTWKWGEYWSEYIKDEASKKGVSVETTEMWDPWDLSDEKHRATFDHPQIYSFVDISQNNHQKGQTHWDNMQKARKRLFNRPRPVNNVKIYGADTGRFGHDTDGIERFWRNIFGGCASARFHRPVSGHGLSPTAQHHIQSMRMLFNAMNVFGGEPHNDLLSEREENEAYCFGDPEKELAVVFFRKGEVVLDTSRMQGDVVLKWLHIPQNSWLEPEYKNNTGSVKLITPLESIQAVLLKKSAS